jgi:excinuclease UvrABC nuclease subunit
MAEFEDEIQLRMLRRWDQFFSDVKALLQSPSHRIIEADLPSEPGVYIIVDEQLEHCYVGKATRSLQDRVVIKHVSGDESHALQRAYMNRYPDRLERRKYIKENLKVKWLQISDPQRLADLERLLIWLLQPLHNRE